MEKQTKQKLLMLASNVGRILAENGIISLEPNTIKHGYDFQCCLDFKDNILFMDCEKEAIKLCEHILREVNKEGNTNNIEILKLDIVPGVETCERVEKGLISLRYMTAFVFGQSPPPLSRIDILVRTERQGIYSSNIKVRRI